MTKNRSPTPKGAPFNAGLGLVRIDQDRPWGGAVSLVLHAGFVAAALFTWQNTPRIMPDEVIAVDVVSDVPSGVGEGQGQNMPVVGTQTDQPNPLPQPLEAAAAPPSPAPPEPQPTLPPPTAPQPAPIIEPTRAPPPPPVPARVAPTPAPRPPPVARALPPPPSAKPAPNPAPANTQAKTQAQRPSLPANAKVPTKSTPAQPARQARTKADTATPPEFDLAAASAAASGADSGGRRAPQLSSRGQAGRQGQSGGGTQLTGDLEAALRAQIKECWAEPADMSNPRSLLVEVNIELGIDGRLLREPVLVTPSSRAGASASLAVAIDNALRAVRQCAPFNLPADRYETWRSVKFSFDPRRMARP